MPDCLSNIKEMDSLICSSNGLYRNFLGYGVEDTELFLVPERDWNNFCRQRELVDSSYGVYFPRNQRAVIRNENSLSLFHEYFGHGLYCEKSLMGRKLVELEKKLLEEERQEFSSRKFTLRDLKKFRQQNKTFKELENFRQENLVDYELFAIWTEYLLSETHGLKEEFGRKYDSLSGQDKDSVESVINFSKEYGNLATMYAQGMARRTTPERVRGLLSDIYGNKLNDAIFALLYGSKREFSDIDVFVVSDHITPVINDWLDVRSY